MGTPRDTARNARTTNTAAPATDGPSLEDALGRLFTSFAAHFLRGEWPLPPFRVEPRGAVLAIRLRTPDREATITGRASAFLLLAGRFWAQTRPDLAAHFPALLPSLTGKPLGAGSWTNWYAFLDECATKGALHDIACALAPTEPEEAVLIWRRLHQCDDDWSGDDPRPFLRRIPAAQREAVNARTAVIAPLAGRRSFTPLSVAKAVSPFATSSSALERLSVAACLAFAVGQLSLSNRLSFHDVARPALERLIAESDGAAYEVALGVAQQLAAKLHDHAAYAEARALLDALVAAGVGFPETLRQRWECRLYLEDPDAEEDWARADRLETPDEPSHLGPCMFWSGDVTDRRALATARVAKALTARAEGKDPCPDRKAPRKPVAVPVAERARLLAKAAQFSEGALGSIAPRLARDEARARAGESVRARSFQSEDYEARAKVREASGDLEGALEDYRAARSMRVAGGLPWQSDHHGADVRRVARLLAERAGTRAPALPPCFEPAWFTDPKRTTAERAAAIAAWTAQRWRDFPATPAEAVGTPLAYVLLHDVVAHSETLWNAAATDKVALPDRLAFTERARDLLDAHADRRDASRLASDLRDALFVAFGVGTSGLDVQAAPKAKRSPLLAWVARLASAKAIDEATVLAGLEGTVWTLLGEKFDDARPHLDALRELFDAVCAAGLGPDDVAVVLAAYEPLLRNDWASFDRPRKDWLKRGEALARLDAARLAPALVAWTRARQRAPGFHGLPKLEAKWLWPLFHAWHPSTEGFLREVAEGKLDNGRTLSRTQKAVRSGCLAWFAEAKGLEDLGGSSARGRRLQRAL